MKYNFCLLELNSCRSCNLWNYATLDTCAKQKQQRDWIKYQIHSLTVDGAYGRAAASLASAVHKAVINTTLYHQSSIKKKIPSKLFWRQSVAFRDKTDTNKLWFIVGQISVPSVNGFIGMLCFYSRSCLFRLNIFALGLKEYKTRTKSCVFSVQVASVLITNALDAVLF